MTRIYIFIFTSSCGCEPLRQKKRDWTEKNYFPHIFEDNEILFQRYLFYINRTFGSHDMVITYLCIALKRIGI